MRTSILATVAVLASCGAVAAHDRGTIRGRPVEGMGVGDVPVRGAHVVVTTPGGDEVEGELLAVSPDGVIVETGDGRVSFQLGQIEEVEIDTEPERDFAAWGTVGGISTLSHGVWLVFTVIPWIAMPIAAAQKDYLVVRPERLWMLHQWARWPQGMPVLAGPGGP